MTEANNNSLPSEPVDAPAVQERSNEDKLDFLVSTAEKWHCRKKRKKAYFALGIVAVLFLLAVATAIKKHHHKDFDRAVFTQNMFERIHGAQTIKAVALLETALATSADYSGVEARRTKDDLARNSIVFFAKPSHSGDESGKSVAGVKCVQYVVGGNFVPTLIYLDQENQYISQNGSHTLVGKAFLRKVADARICEAIEANLSHN